MSKGKRKPTIKQATTFSSTVDRWISKIKAHPIVAIAILVGAALAGVVVFADNARKLAFAIMEIRRPAGSAAIALSPSSSGYEESDGNLGTAFGVSSREKYKSFELQYPYHKTIRPLFIVTITNDTDDDIALVEAVYDVISIGGVNSITPGPLRPLHVYAHRIPYAKGSWPRSLSPAFGIPKKSVAALELEINSEEPGKGLAWFLRIGFRTNKGHMLYSEKFVLYLPEVSSDLLTSDGRRLNATNGITDVAQPSHDVLQRRVSISFPSPSHRDCIFHLSGIAAKVAQLDALDLDFLYRRAAHDTLSEFLEKETKTEPPLKYGSFISINEATTLLKAVKTFRACGR